MLDKKTREDLLIKGETLKASYDFWETNISALAEKINIISSRDILDEEELEELEKLTAELGKWQRRGEIEERIRFNYSRQSEKLLLNNLLSGCNSICWDKQ